MQEVDALEGVDIRLIDAHSFLWIINEDRPKDFRNWNPDEETEAVIERETEDYQEKKAEGSCESNKGTCKRDLLAVRKSGTVCGQERETVSGDASCDLAVTGRCRQYGQYGRTVSELSYADSCAGQLGGCQQIK